MITGIVPGTSIQFSFWQILTATILGVLAFSITLFVRRKIYFIVPRDLVLTDVQW